MLTTSTGSAILRPEQVSDLLIIPTMAASIAAQISTIINTSSTTFRIPFVSADPTAAWVSEGAEITPSDGTLSELIVTPSKLAGLSIISRELADDSSPQAATAVGDGLARDIARKLDAAFFGAMSLPAQSGLGALSGISTYVNAGAFANLDFAAQAISKAEVVGATITAFVTTPAVALLLATIKTGTGLNAPLLVQDGTRPGARQILGVPLFVSPSVAANTLWAIDSSRAFMVVRGDSTVEADSSVFFTSDRVAVRAVMRVGFGYPHPASVVKVTLA